MNSIGTCLCLLTFHVLFLLLFHGQPFGIHRLFLHIIQSSKVMLFTCLAFMTLLLPRLVIHGPFNVFANNHLLAPLAPYTVLVSWRYDRRSMSESVPAGHLLCRSRCFLSHVTGSLQS
jgi:hypothetical protein